MTKKEKCVLCGLEKEVTIWTGGPDPIPIIDGTCCQDCSDLWHNRLKVDIKRHAVEIYGGEND